MKRPYWKYLVALYILISITNITTMLLEIGGGEEAPFGIGAEILSEALTSFLDLVPVAIIGILVEFIIRRFTNKTFFPNLVVTLIVYVVISTVIHNL